MAFMAWPFAVEMSVKAGSNAEPELALVDQETFEAELREGWWFPPGWSRIAGAGGTALHITPAQAGLSSAAQAAGDYSNVLLEGHFTFASITGTAQLSVRGSGAGSYVAQLDAAGRVTLEKRGTGGTVTSSWRDAAEPQAVPGSARVMQLSAMGGSLRVTVDGIDVLTVNDATPLPQGANGIGALFAAPNGALTFDNYSVWVPANEAVPGEMTEAPSPSASKSAAPTGAPLPKMAPKAPAASEADPPPPPANDEFANRISTTAARYAQVGDNSSAADNEMDEPVPTAAANTARTVWYEFTPGTSKDYTITTFGSSFNTVLTVYTGTGTLASLTEEATADDVAGSQQAQLTLPLVSGTTYYIQLGGRDSSGSFEFRIMDPSDVLVPSTPTISSIAAGAPSAPLANLARTNLLQPVLAWRPRPTITPYAYLAEVSTVPTFSSLVTSGTVTEPSQFWRIAPALSNPALPAGQTYYWRVTAMNFLGQTSTSSPAYSFTLDTSAPSVPALIAPTLNQVVSTLRPAVKWQAISDAAAYHVRIATNFSVTTTVGNNDVIIAGTTYTPNADIPQGEYWYGVESMDAAGNLSGFGQKRRFLINVSLTPSDHANVITASPYTPNVVLTWTPVPGASYSVDVARDSSFTDMVVYHAPPTGPGASHTLTSLPIGTYYWRVTVNGNELPTALARRFNVTPALPTAPTIQTTGTQPRAVANNGVTNDDTPMLDWTVPDNWKSPPPGSSIWYELQLATDSAFTQLVGSSVTGILDDHYEWPSALTPGMAYYWRVRAVTNLGVPGTYSTAYRFTLDMQAPLPPALTSPAPDGVVSTVRPTLTWKAVADATRYRARITTDPTGTSLGTGVEGEVTGTSFTPAVNVPQGAYWYCVESRDAAGNWSGFVGEVRRFVINLSLTPANGGNVIASGSPYAANVALKWTAVPGVTQYRIEVASNPSFSSSTIHVPSTSTSHTLTGMPIGTCYWRVLVTGAPVLPGSLAHRFTVTPALPVAPLIQTTGAQPGAVGNAAVINDTTPMLDWTVPSNWMSPPGGSTLTYELQLATNSTFTQMMAGSPVTVGADSHYQWPTELASGAGTTYYWRARAITNLGVVGAFSSTYRFTIDTQPPALPVLASPAVDGVVSTLRPTVTWKAVTGATRYRVRITSDSAGTTPVTGGELETAALSFIPTVDVPQGEYWYCVESRDAVGNWSGFVGEIRRFVVNLSLTPAQGASVVASTSTQQANVVLTWTKVTGATHSIQVARDSDFTDMVVNNAPPTGTGATYTLTNLAVGTYFWRVSVNGDFLPLALARRFTVTPSLPVAPLIQTVAAQPGAVGNAGFTNDTTPVLDWTVPTNWAPPPSGGPLTYELQLAANNTFTQGLQTAANIADSHYAWHSALTPAMVYYWRVRAVTDLGVPGAYSATYRFTVDTSPPLPPQLSAPALNGVVSALPPTISWKAVADATRYRARIATNFSASTLYSPDTEVITTGLSFTPLILVPQGEYWYCVESCDAAGNWSGFGEKRRFTSNLSLTPANGTRIVTSGTSTTSNVVLTWAKVTGATSYTIEVATDSSFTDTVTYGPSNTTTTTLTARPFGTYYWRVIPNNSGPAPSSLARNFVVTPALPAAPLIQTTGAQPSAVTNAGVTSDTTPVLDWTVPTNWTVLPSAQSIWYELQLATDSAFTQLVGGTSVTGIPSADYEWVNTPLSPGTTYYWRVRAVTNLQLAGAYSPTYRFTLDTQAPATPALTSPVANAVVTTLRPTLTWKTVADATRYRARITTDAAGTNPVTGGEGEVTGTSFTPTADIPQGEYWYCVESRDAAGNWSGFVDEIRRFVINVSLTPANGANVIAASSPYTPNVVLTWTKVTGATYAIEVATDSSFTAPVFTDGPLISASYSLPNRPVGIYYWRVSVNGAQLPGRLARTFTVTLAPPTAPFLQTTGAQPGAVANGGVTTDTTPFFDWSVPTNWVSPPGGSTITYELELSTNSTFTQIIDAVTGISADNYTWPTPLIPGRTYYWRVRAVTNLGVQGTYSAVYRFTLQ